MDRIIFARLITLLLFLCATCTLRAQELPDSSTLDPITINAFEQHRVVNNGTIIKLLTSQMANRANGSSIVTGINTVAGVRMEERSPGSYRLNIRGSALRSPFGVRNVKLYWNNIPVTDAGGNTYLNMLTPENFAALEIIKGPAGSLYGAGTGGVLLFHNFDNNFKPGVALQLSGGSYGLRNISASAAAGDSVKRMRVTVSSLRSGGYRSHTAVAKDNISLAAELKNNSRQQLTASLLYTHLNYETPGALTLSEFLNNPKLERPAAGGFPGATIAKAAIDQHNLVAGLTSSNTFNTAWKNVTTVFGTYNKIENPTFRNYEQRDEPGFGARSTFVYSTTHAGAELQWVGGTELQTGFFTTRVSRNKNGVADSLLTDDHIRYFNYSLFTQATAEWKSGWVVTAGASFNGSRVSIARQNVLPTVTQVRTYKSEISPRFAVEKKIRSNSSIFASVAKGFSPPGIAELLPSTGVISTFLQAESGINYEAGTRITLLRGKMHFEASGFYFRLNNTLVSRKDSSNADYFVNAGHSLQRGIECSADYGHFFKEGIVSSFLLKGSYTYNHFTYGSFVKGNTDLSGKILPGIPTNALALTLDMQLKAGFYLAGTFYSASSAYLDDANTASDDAYHLLGCRMGWKSNNSHRWQPQLFVGADNLLNETYSLGNDLNAAGGRYYNAAPKRNYYAGVAMNLHR